ncbi:MAG TPA: hypothetical protein VF765_38415 [Polyangiaceae bacterium]
MAIIHVHGSGGAVRRAILAVAALSLAGCNTSVAQAPPIAAAAAQDAPGPLPVADPGEYAYSTAVTGDIHDFDFLAGAWTLRNRRLKKRFVGSNDWDEFPAVDCAQLYLGAIVNVDEIQFPTRGWAGTTVRSFDLEKRQWSIWWISSRAGKLTPPVVGGFSGDRGVFYGEDVDDGRPVKARFLWIKQGPDHAHWEQAFSLDGKSWEVNWVNDLTRADPSQVCQGVSPRK